jgi:uncharacterized membrane protein
MSSITPSPAIRGAEVDMQSVRDRFGGADIVAALLGMFTAVGVLVFLGSLILAGNAGIDYQLNAIQADGTLNEVEAIGTVVAVVTLFVSFVVGGWATGRMARYDGAINGLGAGLLFILLVALMGVAGAWFGSEYNAFAAVDLPNWFAQFDADDVTVKAILAAAVGIVTVLFGGLVGGRLGEQYHREPDAALVDQTIASDRQV